METRSFASGAYCWGFNGKEKDDEIKGEGNAVDFGARIYDGRLGRWMSVDPSIKKHADQSSYKAFNNSPFIYIDPDGKDEFLILKTINKASGKTEIRTIKVSDDFHERKVWSSNSWSRDEYYEYAYFNTFTSATIIIEKDGTISGQNFGTVLAESPSYTHHPLLRGMGPWPGSAEGNGSTRPGGVHLTSDDGGEMPSKIKTTEVTNTYNITTLIDVLGLKNPEKISKVLDLSNQLKSIWEKAQEVKEIHEEKEKVEQSNPQLELVERKKTFLLKGKNNPSFETTEKVPKTSGKKDTIIDYRNK